MSDTMAKAGRLMMIDRGSYNNYEVIGVFVVLSDFDIDVVLKDYLDENPDQGEHYGFSPDQFLSFILKKGLMIEIDLSNLYLGDCCNIKEISFTP